MKDEATSSKKKHVIKKRAAPGEKSRQSKFSVFTSGNIFSADNKN